jgi:diguanylate cyclase (GGDEF)-like protein
MEAQSWLCPGELDRVRVVEAGERIRHARTIAAAAVGAALVGAAPWIGWWILLLFAAAVLNLATLEWRFRRSDRPERVAAASLLFNLALFAAGAAFSGGPESPALPWMVIPAAMATTRFRGEVVVVGVAITALAVVAVTMGVDPAGTLDEPVLTLVTLSLLISVTASSFALMNAELTHRDAAVLDPLTGLLNRQALETRAIELEHQARLTGDSVCFVACDLDGFKRVNDTHGHDRGDVVLQATAYELRKALRSFELIYRLGGEEFLVVLPGVGLKEGMAVAERLRRALADAHPGGLELTMSVGVSADAGERASYARLFKAADEALYRAKREGRDRVVGAEPSELPRASEAAELSPAPA